MNNVLTKKFVPNLQLTEFLEESKIFIQEYSCPLCEGILHESVIDKCGHSFCRNCVEILLKETTSCPFTGIEISPKEGIKGLSANRVLNSMIEKQKVYCKNKNKNCEWVGKLFDRKNHLAYDCIKEDVLCEYAPECLVKISRDQLQVHVKECPFRIIICHHCQQSIHFHSLDEHYKSCENFPVECTNKCGMLVPLSKLSLHIESFCDNSVTECPFGIVGCDFYDLRKSLKLHLNDDLENHLKLINKKIRSLEEIVNYQKSQILSLSGANKQLKEEIDEIKVTLLKSQEDITATINSLAIGLESCKSYLTIPLSNYIPNFFTMNDTQIKNSVHEINSDNYSIKKITENYGWYGISSAYLECYSLNASQTKSSTMKLENKIVMNMKILKTANSCIMFGITLSELKCPLENGFYNRTSDDHISFMYYCYNSAIYHKGVSTRVGQNPQKCVDNDIVTLILDFKVNTLSFRKNGMQVCEAIEIENLSQLKIRAAVDLCDQFDHVQFLS